MAHLRGLILRSEDRPVLEPWTRSQTLPHSQVQRTRMLPGLAAGKPLVAVGVTVGTTHGTVASWRNCYLAEGLVGLADQFRRGRPPVYTEVDERATWQKLRDVVRVLEKTKPGVVRLPVDEKP